MEKLVSSIEKLLLPLATKLSANIYLKAISEAFSKLLPITMLGAIFTLIGSLQIAPYQTFITATKIKTIVDFVPGVTTNMLALYVSFLVASSLSEKLEAKEYATIIGMLSMFCFLLSIPLGVNAVEGELKIFVPAALGTRWLGAQGMFSAMFIGIIVPKIYLFFINKNIVIKLPDSVPTMISNSFSALIPTFFIGFLFGLIRFLFSLTSFGSINDFIYKLLQLPLTSLGASPLTFVLFLFVSNLLWFFGLHGGSIVMPFLTMLYTAASLENLEAYGAGVSFNLLPNKITMGNWLVYGNLGGAGGTLGLCLVMFIFAKSSRYKTFSKIALPPGFFGINEPVTFGLPMVLNTTMIIPLILTPIITFGLSYILTLLGILPPLNGVSIPLGTPVIFSGWISGGFRVALFQIIAIFIQCSIYYPFFKILDKQECKTEGIE